MITLKASTLEPTPLDDIITMLERELLATTPDSDRFSKIADQLIKLSKHRDDITSRKRLSADKLADVVVNLAGILAVLNFERTGIVLSKAFGLVKKL